MPDESKSGLSSEELEAQSGETLPDREAMSLIALEPQGIHDLELQTEESTDPVEPDKGPLPGQIDY